MKKILVLGSAAWDDTNSLGNTYSNLFMDWESAEFTNVYSRAAMPDNQICTEYYRITEKSLIQNLFTPEKIGESFSTRGLQKEKIPDRSSESAKESKLIALVHKYKLNKLIYAAQNGLWSLKGWQNQRYETYLRERNPEVVFTFAIPTVQNYLQLQYLKEKLNIPIAVFLVDNVCGKYLSSAGKRGKGRAKRLKGMFSMADKIYAISEELQEVYSTAFGAEIDLLRKGCDFGAPVKETVGDPIRIVYAGNLLYGRLEILEKLGRTIAKINESGTSMFLDIYSGTSITEADQARLNIPNACQFLGSRPYGEIRELLNKGDIVLHVESFEPKQIAYVKYSFSTKITDALESGSAFLVIGPKGIASVELPRRIPGAVVVDDLAELEASLCRIAENPGDLVRRARETRDYALENFSAGKVRSQLRKDLSSLAEEKRSTP